MWKPKSNPDPDEILTSTYEDQKKKKYKTALEKHIWFHENALKIRPSLYGVRLSFALSSWFRLAEKYKPAIDSIYEMRNKTVKRTLRNKKVGNLFHDLQVINSKLDDNQYTIEIFKKLEKKGLEYSSQVYNSAKDVLIQNKEFKVCKKYVKPEKEFKSIKDIFRINIEFAQDHPKGKKRLLKFSKNQFLYDTRMLVALLINLNRNKMANNIANESMEILKVKTGFSKSLQGKVPKRKYT